MKHPTNCLIRLVLLGVLGGASLNASTLIAYVSAPGVQSSFLTAANGAVIETFDSLSTGNRTTDYNSALGTYQLSSSTPFNIQSANQFGGAAGSRYMTFGAQSGTSSPIELDLNQSYNYFGFWWSAADPNNAVSFYSGNTLLGSLTAAQLSAIVPSSGQVQALNGTIYNGSQYYGNPNNGQDSAEIFAYLNFVGSGLTFDRVLFSNNGQTGTGFEQDNHTVYLGNVTVPGTLVPLATVVAPEPGTYLMAATALALIVFRKRAIRA